jgi:hypothetical protein
MLNQSFELTNDGCNKEIVDISHEIFRTYTFPSGHVITISNPIALHSCDDCHIIVDNTNKRFQVPRKWICIEVCVPDGCNIL